MLSKGPNYREPKTLNYQKCKQTIDSSITSYIDSLSLKYKLPAHEFFAWRSKILEIVQHKIQVLRTKNVPCTTKPILRDHGVQEALSEIHSKFVVVPIDKATNNVAIICKRLFLHIQVTGLYSK